MAEHPYVVLSCAVSLDGYLDDATPERLLLSNDADFDRVDALRASCDAILVGARTVRVDNPRLLVRSAERRAARIARGEPASPLRVVLSTSGNLDRNAAVFTAAPPDAEPPETDIFSGSLPDLLDNLAKRGVRRLMVEGGASVLTAFLAEDLADELQIAFAPFLIGDPAAPRAFAPARFAQSTGRRMVLADSASLGDVAFARYLVARERTTDADFLRLAIELSRSCPPSPRAFSVGAIVVDGDGQVISTGYSRELLRALGDPDKNHAEEVALAKLSRRASAKPDPRLAFSTVYTSLEPCSPRASRPLNCTDLILAAGIPRVVLAMREPALLAVCDGADRLRAAGVEVVELPELAYLVRAVNDHLLR